MRNRIRKNALCSAPVLLAPLFVMLSFVFVPAASGQQEKSFRVSGAVAKPGIWTLARLTKEFAAEIKTVDYVLKNNKGQARCVPLLAVLKASHPRLNPKVKNHHLAFTALVRADDGYTISFSWGELQPDVGKREVWLALDRNGQPIPGEDGPVELIVLGDEKPSRWVHGIARIVVADGIALTEQ